MKTLPLKMLKKVIKQMAFPYSTQILRALDIFNPDPQLNHFSVGSIPGEPNKIVAHFRKGAFEVADNGCGKFQIWQDGDDALTFEVAVSKLQEIAADLPSPQWKFEEKFASLTYYSWRD